jgi:hypothetical protein
MNLRNLSGCHTRVKRKEDGKLFRSGFSGVEAGYKWSTKSVYAALSCHESPCATTRPCSSIELFKDVPFTTRSTSPARSNYTLRGIYRSPACGIIFGTDRFQARKGTKAFV